jgi:hypothetical protein
MSARPEHVAVRFGNQPVRFININFGQVFLYDEDMVQSAAQFSDKDHAIVQLRPVSDLCRSGAVAVEEARGSQEWLEIELKNERPDNRSGLFTDSIKHKHRRTTGV